MNVSELKYLAEDARIDFISLFAFNTEVDCSIQF